MGFKSHIVEKEVSRLVLVCARCGVKCVRVQLRRAMEAGEVQSLAVLLGFNDKRNDKWLERLQWIASLPVRIRFFLPVDTNGNGAPWVMSVM